MRQPRESWALDTVLVAIPLGVAALILATAVNFPYWDEWEWADLVFKMHVGTLHFADLWQPHNEHRILFPTLIMLGLAKLGGWSPVREQFLSLAVLVLMQIVVLGMLRKSMPNPRYFGVAAVLASIVLFGLWQDQNLTWGFQMSWFLCDAAALLVAAVLARPGRSFLDVLVAVGLGVFASFSSAQGLVTWLVGAVAIVLVPRRLVRTLTFWAFAALATYLVYHAGMVPVKNGHLDIVHEPWIALEYIFAYLGAPLGQIFGWPVCAAVGFAGLLGASAALTTDLSRPDCLRHLVRRAPWYALASFPVASGALTALGRAGFGMDQALVSRYTTIADLLWVALLGIAMTYVTRITAPFPAKARTLVALGLAVFALPILAQEDNGWRDWHDVEQQLRAASIAIGSGGRSALWQVYPDPERVEILIRELRAVRDGPFRNG